MTRSLINRVLKLEQERHLAATDPRYMTDKELIWIVRDGLEKEFHAGRLTDIEHKIRGYEATGKTLYDLSEEEPAWFDKCLERVIEHFETREADEVGF